MILPKTEAKIQQEIFIYLNNKYCTTKNNPKSVVFSVVNESMTSQRQKTNTGLVAGVSDLVFVTPNNVFFIEVKTSVGRQSAKQIAFEKTVSDLGYKYIIARCVDDISHL